MVETVGVVGLGLIGGSMAKAIHQYTDCTLLGYDLDGAVLSRALDEGVLAAALTPDRLAECDLVIILTFVRYCRCLWSWILLTRFLLWVAIWL